MLAVDPFAVFFKVLTAVSTLCVIVFSAFSSEVQQTVKRKAEYYALLVSMTLGTFLMAGAGNLLMMVLSIELTGYSCYILAGYTKEASDSSEASMKYILYGAVASAIMLYGISLLFGLTGQLEFGALNHRLMVAPPNYITLMFAVIFIVAGLGYKISAVPFHFWTPDVYEGAPVTVTAQLSVASKAAGFALTMRFFKSVFIDTNMFFVPPGSWLLINGADWAKLFAILAVLTMTLGNLVAVWQNNMKRLLAYSSIAHAGYMLMGFVVLNDKGFAAIMIYLVFYLLMNLGAFLVVMIVAAKTGKEEIDAYKGLGYRSPVLSVAMAVFLVSLAGLPPTAGFIGKWYLFAALLDAKLIWLAVIGVINSVVSLYYYARVLRSMFLRDPEDASPVHLRWQETVLVLLFAVPIIFFGLYFTPIVNLVNNSLLMFGAR
jgi:NADH-quinone oxidoreductase subunit N